MMEIKLALLVFIAVFASANADTFLICDFSMKQVAENFGYTCTLTDIFINGDSDAVHVIGNHLQGRNSDDVHILDVQTQLRSINNDFFRAFVNLEALQLFRTGITFIDSFDLYDAEKLKFLQIVNGNISTIPRIAFNFARELTVLRLLSCQVRNIEDRAFFGLSNLRELSLYDNQLTNLRSNALDSLNNLRDFSASHNSLEQIDGSLFANNRRLENILLQDNLINRIGSSFLDNVINLKSLVLVGNVCVNQNFNLTLSGSSGLDAALRVCFENDHMTITPPTTSTQMSTFTRPTTTSTVISTTSQPPEIIQLNCTFAFISSEYTCTLQNIHLTNERAVYTVSGSHSGGQNNGHVTQLRILNSNVHFIITDLFNIFTNLVTINYSASGLTTILNTDFDNAKNLRNLQIFGAALRTLEDGSFTALENLQTLTITYSSIVEINANAFVGLSKLLQLQLMGNNVEELKPNTLAPLTDLLGFSMSENKLKRVDESTFAMNLKLQSINLEQNEIIEIDRAFIEHLVNLRSLRLSSNRCSMANFGSNLQFEFDREIINYELKQCYANVYIVNPIVPEFLQLNCSLAWVNSAYTCTLNNVQTSNDNAIFRVFTPHTSGMRNSNIEAVRIQNSNITFIITRLFDVFTGIKNFQIWSSGLRRIKETDFDNAGTLTSISISGAPQSFQVLEANSFRNLTRLQILYLNSNNFEMIHENAFAGLSALIELQIRNNELKSLHVNVLKPLPQLRTFFASSNSITNIERQHLTANINLQSVDLSFNKIARIENGFIDGLTSLRRLDVSSNLCADASFGDNLLFAFDRPMIDYEMKQCYENVNLFVPIVPEIIQLNCALAWVSSAYTCTLNNVHTSNDNAIFRVIASHSTGMRNSNVETLRIQSSNITFIITRVFDIFTGLKTLQLTNSGLRRIKETDFDKAGTLTMINLSGASNNFQILEANSFRNLTNLYSLRLLSTELGVIDQGAFNGLTALSELQLSHNAIKELNVDTFKPLRNLRILYMSYTLLTKIQKDLFIDNLNLQSIDLSSNEIIEVDQGFIDDLPRLTILKLSRNRCANADFGINLQFAFNRPMIDYEMKQCYENVNLFVPIVPEIIQLNCSLAWVSSAYTCTLNNVHTSNDNAIFRIFASHSTGMNNGNVETLRIQNSNITFIITRVFDIFTGLRTLLISNGGLTRIKETDFETAGTLTSILITDASRSFQVLEANSFHNLTNLLTIQITSSNLKTINRYAFNGLSRLTTLILNNNQIETIQEEAFHGLTALLELQLNLNLIESLNVNTFRPLEKLRSFSMMYNSLERIDKRLFEQNLVLRWINLDFNKIERIEDGFIDHLTQLETLTLAGNLCGNANFGINLQFAFNREWISYELKQCYENVNLFTPIVPEIIQLNCTFAYVNSLYTCTLQNIRTSNANAIFRVSGTHSSGMNNAQITSLRILNSEVDFVISRLFRVFPAMRTLIYSSRLKRINSFNFEEAKNLRSMQIINGDLNQLDQQIFSFLTNLEILHITMSNVNSIHRDAFAGLSNLIELNIDSNNLQEFEPETFVPLKKLRSIQVIYNKLKQINAQLFATNSDLETIDLRNNEINGIGAGFIESLGKLKILRIENNLCTHVSFGMNLMFAFDRKLIDYELKICYVNYNSLSPITPKVVNLNCTLGWVDSLYTCTLNNIVTSNENAIFRVFAGHSSGMNNDNVSTVRLMNVRFILSRLFVVFQNMRTYIHAGGIERLEASDFANVTLTTLTITNGNIAKLNDDVFSSLTSLRALRLQLNLKTVSENTFTGLSNLEVLNLDGNIINDIGYNLFKLMPKLTKLAMSQNKLVTIRGDTFIANTLLKEIDLSFNDINFISSNFINNLNSLILLDLTRNLCVDRLFSSPFNRNQVNTALSQCYQNFG